MMRKTVILILAGILAVMGFSTCHNTKSVVKTTDQDSTFHRKVKPNPDNYICLYGSPDAFYKYIDKSN